MRERPRAKAPETGQASHGPAAGGSERVTVTSSSPLESPVARIPAAVAEETEYVRLGPGSIGFTRNPADADLSLEEAEGQAAVDPRTRPVPPEAFALRRQDARAGHEVSAAVGALLTVAAGLMKPSDRDTATGAIHGSSLSPSKEENLAKTFIVPFPE